MTDSFPSRAGGSSGLPSSYGGAQGSSANLADILERVLDKGLVIAGDIQINLLDIELLTIKLRLLVASVDKAKEIGIDWWEHDPSLSSRARREGPDMSVGSSARGRGRAVEGDEQAEELARLRAEVRELRAAAGLPEGARSDRVLEAEPADREPAGDTRRSSTGDRAERTEPERRRPRHQPHEADRERRRRDAPRRRREAADDTGDDDGEEER